MTGVKRRTGVMSDDVYGAAAAVEWLVVVSDDNKPVLSVELHVLTHVLGVGRLRRHRPQTLARPAFLILDLVVLDVVTVGLLWCQ